MNAGGNGSNPSGKQLSNGATEFAKMNLIEHAVLIQHLLDTGKVSKGSIIVASGSEAALAVVGPKLDWDNANFVAHLEGKGTNPFDAGVEYCWNKGILALYWASFAYKHPDLVILTVSPGATKGTNLLKQGAMSTFVMYVTKLLLLLYGLHSIKEGA